MMVGNFHVVSLLLLLQHTDRRDSNLDLNDTEISVVRCSLLLGFVLVDCAVQGRVHTVACTVRVCFNFPLDLRR